MKRKAEIFISVFILLGGLLLMLYPWISNYAYEHEVASTVNVYEDSIKEVDDTRIKELMEEAMQYNRDLAQSQVMLTDPFLMEEEHEDSIKYDELLDLDGSGIMCFIDIPKINVYLPVYHGTSTEVLMKGIGHIEGSSLPIGGSGSHAVLSGHTGVDKAKLFTDLTEMKEEDLFFIHVLGETLAYRVCRIMVIEPEDTSGLITEDGRDLVSLLTCTPYGVNTHRLVVTGERTEYTQQVMEEAIKEENSASSQWAEAYKKALIMGVMVAGFIFALFFIVKKAVESRKKKEGERHG